MNIMNIIKDWLKTHGSNEIAKFVEQQALDRLINETNRIEAENIKLKLLIVSRSAKVKVNEPFEIEGTGEKYKVEIENYVDDNGLWDKKTVIVKAD